MFLTYFQSIGNCGNYRNFPAITSHDRIVYLSGNQTITSLFLLCRCKPGKFHCKSQEFVGKQRRKFLFFPKKIFISSKEQQQNYGIALHTLKKLFSFNFSQKNHLIDYTVFWNRIKLHQAIKKLDFTR